MLKSINIFNFAVIDRLQVDFQSGLNVLTGETGSGKSIIVDALSLLLGGRSSPAQIRTGEAIATVEGAFQITGEKGQGAQSVLSEIGLEKSRELVIRREIYAAGRGRLFINNKSATIGTLRKLQPFLAEIYGQGEQRSLLTAQSHRELLDHFGECVSLRKEVKRIFLRLKSAEQELKQLVGDTIERELSRDFIQHQLAEIDAVRPGIGEDNELLAERKLLANAERIIELCSSAYNDLYESDESVLGRLALIRRQLEELGGFIGNAGLALESLLSGIASLSDVAEALRSFGSKIEYSPARLVEVESRLADIEKLKRKYGTDLAGILKVRDELSGKLDSSVDVAERLNALKKEVEDLRHAYIESARRLTACRRAGAPLLEQRVMDGLRHLAMEQAKFLISIETSTLEDDGSVDESSSTESADEFSGSAFFTPSGADYVEFLLSANPGESLRPLSYVASGGELSRLMLALRTASHEEDQMIETIIFDEIDVGIGGRVAEAVGQRLKTLAASRQVFCVTHQAQIAKFADHHFLVTKAVQHERTSTAIKKLSPDERINELSRMIGGDETAEKTRAAAQWLLENVKSPGRRRTKKSN